MLSPEERIEIAKKFFENNDRGESLYVTSDGQIFLENAEQFAVSHMVKTGGDLLLVKKEDVLSKKEEVEDKVSVEEQEVQPKKKFTKSRGGKKPSSSK